MTLMAVFVKSLKEQVRRVKVLVLTIGLPVLFMLIFGFAFGAGFDTDTHIAVHDADGGPLAAAFIDGLSDLDGLVVTEVEDLEQGRADVADRDQALLVIVPAGFSDDLAGEDTSHLEFVGDPAYSAFGPATGIVDSYAQAFARQITGRGPVLEVQTTVITSDELEPFDFIAPGMMVFAILNMAPQAAGMLAREAESGSLDRVRLSPMRAMELLGGVSLGQLVMATAAIFFMLVTAELLGFHNQGSFLAAYGILLVSTLPVMGIGMVIAALAKGADEAGIIGVIFSVPAAFLSGAYFELPEVRVFDALGETWTPYDLLPSRHAVVVMRSVMTLGEPLADQWPRLLALVVLTALWFAVGAWLYSARRLRAQ